MRWYRETAEADTDDLARYSSPQLLASQLQKACSDYLKLVDRAEAEKRDLIEKCATGSRMWNKVAQARQQGRKMLRINDLTEIEPKGE